MAIEEEFAVEVPDAEADKIRSKIRPCGDAIPTAYLSARPLFLGRLKAQKDGGPSGRKTVQTKPTWVRQPGGGGGDEMVMMLSKADDRRGAAPAAAARPR